MKTRRWCVILVFVLTLWTLGVAQWTKQSGGLPQRVGGNGLAMDACSPSVAVISWSTTAAHMYMTKDAGAHFLPVSAPALPFDISMLDSLHIWFVSDSNIFATVDGGASWQRQFSDGSTTKFLAYLKMFNLSEGVAVGDAPAGKPAAVLRTTDGGVHWVSVNASGLIDMGSGDIWRRIDFPTKMVGYFYTSFGGDNPQKIYKTTDGGASWAPVFAHNGVTVIKFYDDLIGLVTGGARSTFYRTINGGATWDTIVASNIKSGWGYDFEYLPGDPSRVWYTDGNKLFFSNDTGDTWKEQGIDHSVLSARDIAFSDTTHGWLLCDGAVLYRTVNGNQIVPWVDPYVWMEHRAVEYNNHVSSFNTLTVDMGPPSVSIGDTTIRGIIPRVDIRHAPLLTFNGLFDYLQSDTMRLVQGKAVLSFPWQFRSFDLDNFLRPDSSLNIEYDILDIDSGRVIQKALETDIRKGMSMVMDSLTGQYVTGYWVRGMRKQTFDAIQGQRIITRMRLNTGALVDSSLLTWGMATSFYGYADSSDYLKYYPFLATEIPYRVTNSPTEVRISPASALRFSLEQCFPNPFNPSTTIRFNLPKETYVKLEVFNLLGERVATLVNEVRHTGSYSEKFDGTKLPSGVYLYRLQAGGYSATKKLVLLR
jgi:photosystem II stability/assembly factor-like uncharacterized protein